MRRALLIAVSTLLACSARDDAERTDTDTRRTASAIVNGSLDTAHGAVVTVVSDPEGPEISVCSGTIVKTEPENGTGWVATAAHCVVEGDPKIVYEGSDYGSFSRVRHGVISFAADSRFDLNKPEGGYDFAVIRIGNVDASTPFIPLATAPDSVGVGTDIVNIGFGRTTRPPGDDTNSQRWTISKRLSKASDLLIGYDSSESGACQGDSGGPWLVGTGSDMRVVGIDSFGNTNCDGDAFASRVQTGLVFFDKQLGVTGPDDCELCTTVAQSAGGKCEKAQSAGLDACICSGACADACKTDARCTSLPSCSGDACGGDAGTQSEDVTPAPDAGPTVVVVHEKGGGGCNAAPGSTRPGAFALVGFFLLLRLRPFRSRRR